MEALNALRAFLTPELIGQLEEHARTSPAARDYLSSLLVSALVLQHAQRLGDSPTPEHLDDIATQTAHAIEHTFPGGLNGLYARLESLTGSVSGDYFPRKAAIRRAGKTALLLSVGHLLEQHPLI